MVGLVSDTGMFSFASRSMPMNSLTVGYDNSITENNSMIVGSRNNINTTNTLTVGNDNSISSTDKSALIVGDNNSVNNNSNSITSGNNNTLFSGNNILSVGNNNNVAGDNTTILGSNNISAANNNLVSGNNNLVDSSNNYILGNNNTIATYSNVYIIGNNVTAIEDYNLLIDPNIKVQPASLIQDYTPTSQQDITYPVGAITKNDNDIWVRTSGLGWRQIPFNNSFGNFYDTTTQTNPKASEVNKFTFNQVAQSQNVNVVDNSKITVDFDGLYNIQFSAQLDKTDSGSDDIDIWLMYNGVNVDWSNTQLTLPTNNAKLVAAWNLVQPMTASSYIELAWSSADTSMRIFTQGTQSNPTRPGIPSVILTIDKISSL